MKGKHQADLIENSIPVTLTFELLTWKLYITHRSLMGCISATYEANPSNRHQAMKRTRRKIRMTYVTLTFDQLTWRWCASQHALMGCTSATYEANLSNSHQATEQTQHAWRTDGRTSIRLDWWSENNILPQQHHCGRGIKILFLQPQLPSSKTIIMDGFNVIEDFEEIILTVSSAANVGSKS